jgi:hypothetical protein
MILMAGEREIARQLLAALAYRTQKALRGAPAQFPDFTAGAGVRTPHQLVRHMNGMLHYGLMALNFMEANIETSQVRAVQPEPVSPDEQQCDGNRPNR